VTAATIAVKVGKCYAALTAMARSADMDNVASYPVIAGSAIVSVAVISIWRTVTRIVSVIRVRYIYRTG
jgi:hypothetical protein